MALIFHQNMFNFGGRSDVRNAAYTASLNAIGAATGPSYIVAGFTEVLNSDPVLRVTIANLAQTLDPGLTGLVVIEVGTTAVGVRREYIAITWNPEYVTVQHAGQVLWNAAAQTWQAHNTAAAEVVDNRIPLPAGPPLGADTRGLAYIAATYAGANFLFGFMHNMYHMGNKSSAFTNLGTMADNARQAIGGDYTRAEVIIGGDFNVSPRVPKRPRGAALALQSRAARAGGAYVNTTNSNPYDFWVVSNFAVTDAHVAVHPQTRSGHMVNHVSDHAGITVNR